MLHPELSALVTMSRELGQPEHDLAILGEGNTSALTDSDAFWVKASGTTLQGIDEDGFVQLAHGATVALLEEDLASDAAIQTALQRVVQAGEQRPSIEAMMHAYLLTLPGVRFVGHTHPISVNAVLCSVRAEELATASLFPDQIVVCGPAPVFVPYADPGLPLARLVRTRVQAWMTHYGMAPRALLLQNHGLFALGATPAQVLAISLMWDKTARVMLGAMACGGIHPLTSAQIDRIFTRPDEQYRAQALAQ